MIIALTVLLLAAAVTVLVFPLWQRQSTLLHLGPMADQDQERVDLELEREILLSSLSELLVEYERNRLSQEDYERLKATDERHLLQVLDRQEALNKQEARTTSRSSAPPPLRTSGRWASGVVTTLLVLAGTFAVYDYIWSFQNDRVIRAQQQMGQGAMPDPREMVERLEVRLRENPDDLQGQIMAGRSYIALDRIDDAKKAWDIVLRLDPKNGEAHFHTGIIQLTTRKIDDPKLFGEILDHFDIAYVKFPQAPELLWYRGIVFVHLGRYSEADESWTTAYQNLPTGTEDAEFVRTSLESLRAGKPPLF